jgi:hypothetical protein
MNAEDIIMRKEGTMSRCIMRYENTTADMGMEEDTMGRGDTTDENVMMIVLFLLPCNC